MTFSSQNTATAVNLCAGTYTCTVSDATGCITTVTTTITEPTILTANISSFGHVSCNGLCDGFAQVTAGGGTPGYTYNWNNGAGTGAIANNLCPNTYSVTVTDLNGCTVVDQIQITEPTVLAASTSFTNVSCFGACDGTASVSVSGGSGPYTYLWNNPTFSTTSSVTGLCAGAYTCTITDNNGCQIIENFNITEPNNMSLVANITDANCSQANGEICVNVVGGIAPYTYQWSDPNTTTTSCLSNVVSGCYNITIIDANGCILDSLICINDLTGPTVAGINSNDVTCFGDMDGMVEFTVNGGTGISNYELFDANNVSVSVNQLLTNNLDGGCYTLVATDQMGCTGSDVICISEPNQLFAAVTSSTDVDCNLAATGAATVSVSGGLPGYVYNWNGGAFPNAAVNSGFTAGNYTVTVTDQNNCATTASVIIDQPAPILISTINQVNTSCNGDCDGSALVNTTGGTAPYVYSWNPSVSNGPAIGSLCAGVYTVDVTDANSCVETHVVIITEPAVLTGSSNVINASCSFCNGEATAVPAGGTGPFTYQWLNGGNNPLAATNTGLCPGIHNVIITDANGCTTTIQIPVNDDIGPTITGFNLNTPSCNGLNNGSAEVLFIGGTAPITFQWDANAFNQVSNPAVGLAGGTYCVTISDANNCQVTQCITLQEPAPLLPIPDIDATICFGDSSQLWAGAVGGTAPYNINWTTPGLAGTGPITVAPITSTSYCFNVTDANGCLSPVGCVDIQVVSPLSLSLTTTSGSICRDDSIQLTATGGGGNGGPYNLTWYDDDGFIVPSTQVGNQSIIKVSPTSTSYYYVNLSDGCTVDAIDSSQVVLNPTPIPTLSAVQTIGCTPFPVQFIGNSDIGVIYQFDFGCDGVLDYSGPNPNPTFTFVDPGFHDVCMTVISADGCDTSVTYSQMIQVLPLPVAEFVASPANTTTLNPTITFTDLSTSSAASVSYDWNFGDGYTITGAPNAQLPFNANDGLTIGTYGDPIHTYTDTGYFTVTLTVTTVDGCVSQYVNQIHIEGDYILFAPTAFTPDDDGLNEVFRPIGLGLVADGYYTMFVYNRWGEIFYESHDPDEGWDGSNPKNGGAIAKPDVYIWMIQARDEKGRKHQYVGHVTLIR